MTALGTRSDYQVRPINHMDLAHIIWNLWPRGLEELGRIGVTPWQAFERFKRCVGEGGRHITLWAGSQPVMASGIGRQNNEYVTWFIATNEFNQHYRAITRTLKRECDVHAKPIMIYSVTVHPLTERWFQSLGFSRDAWEGKTGEGYPMYRFRRDE